MKRTTWVVILMALCGLQVACQEDRMKGLTINDLMDEYWLDEVGSTQYQWTGAAVLNDGRIVVNFPLWGASVPKAVALLENGRILTAYPNPVWNQWRVGEAPDSQFVCVQALYVDAKDRLWVLDTGNAHLAGVIAGAAKLVQIDTALDEVVRIIFFGTEITSGNSYLNDIRIDVETEMAYLTDSGIGGLVVLDLESGVARRVLDNHASTHAEDLILNVNGQNLTDTVIHADGIALDASTKMLYYMALCSRHLYAIPLDGLNNALLSEDDLARQIVLVAEPGPSDGLIFYEGYIWTTAIEENALKKVSKEGEITLAAQHSQLTWPDSYCVDTQGNLFVTTSRIAFPARNRCKIFEVKKWN
jgi:sugar lactone lactonase YvrE